MNSQKTHYTYLDSHQSLMPKTDSSETDSSPDCSLSGNASRPKWDHSREFVFAVAGCAIGLGNVWRFPYLCYKNGGGAFVLAYLCFLFLVGVPIMMLEVSMGQFMSRGGIEAWDMVPLFKGVGLAALCVTVYINIYYIVILAWILSYMLDTIVALFSGNQVPWSVCAENSTWSNECCSSNFQNGSLVKPESCEGKPLLPEALYFSNKVLQVTEGIDHTGGMNWPLFGFLALAWTLCFIMVRRGAQSTGKAAYVTATFPVIILFALVARGLTLPGAMIGMRYYLIPDPAKLMLSSTWMDAASQILFSYAICQGSLPALGSYNKWSFNSVKWTVKLSLLNSCASLSAGVAIFSILGHLSHSMGIPIDEVADKGPGLAFIAYPRALAELPISALWNLLFFTMLLFLGLASQCGEVEGMITMMVDLFPRVFKSSKPNRRIIFVGLSCIVCFIVAMPMVLNSGVYYFNLMDSYGASGMALMVVAIFEVMGVMWVYGGDRFFDNLYEMCYVARHERGAHGKTDPNKYPWVLIKFILKYATPLVLAVPLAYNLVNISAPSYSSRVTGDYSYPMVGILLAAFLVMSSIIWIPAYGFYFIIRKAREGVPITWANLTRPNWPSEHPEFEKKAQITIRDNMDDEIHIRKH